MLTTATWCRRTDTDGGPYLQRVASPTATRRVAPRPALTCATWVALRDERGLTGVSVVPDFADWISDLSDVPIRPPRTRWTMTPGRVRYRPIVGGWTMPDGTRLEGVHGAARCAPYPCVIHRPLADTYWRMGRWQLYWRGDRAIFERICPHGIGHPDPSQFAWWEATEQGWQAVHGCDGCCS